jgi:hypothetical protein
MQHRWRALMLLGFAGLGIAFPAITTQGFNGLN